MTFAGLINDVVVGFPLDISSLSYILYVYSYLFEKYYNQTQSDKVVYFYCNKFD